MKKIIIVSILIMLTPFILIFFVGYPLTILLNCQSDGTQVISCVRNNYDYIEYMNIFSILPFLIIFTFPLGLLIIVIGLIIKTKKARRNSK